MAATQFSGFPPEAMDFFRQLKKNNRRDWFQKRKEVYEEKVRGPMIDLVTAFNRQLVRFSPDHVCEPQRAIYRIYRDTRFSKDKTPYKTHIAANFPHQGMEKHNCGGYYFSISPEEVEVAGGLYMPGKEELRAVREHIAANWKEFDRIVKHKALRELMGGLWGTQLSRVPHGFAPDQPGAEYIRYKQWIFYTTDLPVSLVTTPRLLDEVVKRAKAMAPFVDFLNEPLKRLSAKRVDREGMLL